MEYKITLRDVNETIELAKRYSDLEVVKMINATMDAIYHSEDLNGKL